ncbi:protein LNK2-like isoform X4 [Hordeum vulgare subsp. vulgare]|uniref:protein LNK2-like isoform X4 n=1 Tax=Hordeum vulgare subsp. vulgare TaxID=112509 RepID=UPI001D1A356A|nr:protein LNK2-like isoform X4 [Hordeum vulgare subsp. vulgare]
MFDFNSESQQQVGDGIWAERSENEDHIAPCPKGTKDSRSICVGDQKKNDDEAVSVVGLTECTSGGRTEHPGFKKQPATEASGHYSATHLDMESWPDLPLLSTAFDRNYNDNNIASTYLDFNSASSLQKATRGVSVPLDGEPEVFDNEHEEKGNNFLDCDWGNIGDFDDFDCLFSDFLVTPSDVVDGTVQSILFPCIPLNKQPSSDCGSSSLLIDGTPSKIAKQEIKGDVEKRPMKSQIKPDEGSKSKTSYNTSGFSQNQGHQQPDSLHSLSEPPVQHFQTCQYALLHDSKNMEQFQDAIQLAFPGYGYPAYPFSNIPVVSNIQAEDHQTNPKAACYQTSVDPLKQSSSTEKPQDMPSRALTMTPQEKIEKLRRRQQQQALRAIQQQQQQFRQEGSGRNMLVPQAYSRRKKNSDSLGSSGIIGENAPEQTSACHKEIHKIFGIPDDPFLEEKIYYELKDALGKLDARTRLCIRDSLLRLAHSSSQRQIASDRTSSNKTKRDEDEVPENDVSNRRKRYIASCQSGSLVKEAETDTNPIDRIVAHLLFHRLCPMVPTHAKEEIASSTLMSPEAGEYVIFYIPRCLEPRPGHHQEINRLRRKWQFSLQCNEYAFKVYRNGSKI